MKNIEIHENLSRYRNIDIKLVDRWDDELLTEVPTYVCHLGHSTSLSEIHDLIDEHLDKDKESFIVNVDNEDFVVTYTFVNDTFYGDVVFDCYEPLKHEDSEYILFEFQYYYSKECSGWVDLFKASKSFLTFSEMKEAIRIWDKIKPKLNKRKQS